MQVIVRIDDLGKTQQAQPPFGQRDQGTLLPFGQPRGQTGVELRQQAPLPVVQLHPAHPGRPKSLRGGAIVPPVGVVGGRGELLSHLVPADDLLAKAGHLGEGILHGALELQPRRGLALRGLHRLDGLQPLVHVPAEGQEDGQADPQHQDDVGADTGNTHLQAPHRG